MSNRDPYALLDELKAIGGEQYPRTDENMYQWCIKMPWSMRKGRSIYFITRSGREFVSGAGAAADLIREKWGVEDTYDDATGTRYFEWEV